MLVVECVGEGIHVGSGDCSGDCGECGSVKGMVEGMVVTEGRRCWAGREAGRRGGGKGVVAQG